MIFEKILEIFWKSCKFFGFSFYRLSFLSKGNDFHEKFHRICGFSGCALHRKIKKSAEIHAFWTENWRFFRNSAPFLCSKATIDHAASGWCAAVIFWKRSIRFAGLLAVIFTSRWKNFRNLCIRKQFWRLRQTKTTGSKFWDHIFLVRDCIVQDRLAHAPPRRMALLLLLTDERWWVMMSDDEWWGVMRSDDEW